MSKKGRMVGLLEAIPSFMFNRLMKDVGKKIRTYIFNVIKPLIKKIILAIIGATLAIIGAIFVCISLVKYISIYFPAWIAWGLVGLTLLIIGSFTSIMALRK